MDASHPKDEPDAKPQAEPCILLVEKEATRGVVDVHLDPIAMGFASLLRLQI